MENIYKDDRYQADVIKLEKVTKFLSVDLLSLTTEQLNAWSHLTIGLPPYRAMQYVQRFLNSLKNNGGGNTQPIK